MISGTSKALITISNFNLHSRSGLRQERDMPPGHHHLDEAKTSKFKCIHQSPPPHFLLSEVFFVFLFVCFRNGAEFTLLNPNPICISWMPPLPKLPHLVNHLLLWSLPSPFFFWISNPLGFRSAPASLPLWPHWSQSDLSEIWTWCSVSWLPAYHRLPVALESNS